MGNDQLLFGNQWEFGEVGEVEKILIVYLIENTIFLSCVFFENSLGIDWELMGIDQLDFFYMEMQKHDFMYIRIFLKFPKFPREEEK